MEQETQMTMEPRGVSGGPIRIKRETRWLPVTLSKPELLHLGDTCCKAIIEVDELEAQRKNLVAEYKERIKDLEAEVKLLTRKINRGEEDREIEVEIWYDHPEPGVKSIIRLDTGAVINAEPMLDAEKQTEIKFPVIDAEASEENPETEGDPEAQTDY